MRPVRPISSSSARAAGPWHRAGGSRYHRLRHPRQSLRSGVRRRQRHLDIEYRRGRALPESNRRCRASGPRSVDPGNQRAQRLPGTVVSRGCVGPAFDPAGKRIAVVGTDTAASHHLDRLVQSAASVTVFAHAPRRVVSEVPRPTTRTKRWLRRHTLGRQTRPAPLLAQSAIDAVTRRASGPMMASSIASTRSSTAPGSRSPISCWWARAV